MTCRMIDELIERSLNALDSLNVLEMQRVWGIARWYPELEKALFDVLDELDREAD